MFPAGGSGSLRGAFTLGLVLLGRCNAAGPGGEGRRSCSPSGTALSITAFDQEVQQGLPRRRRPLQEFTVEFQEPRPGHPPQPGPSTRRSAAKTLWKGDLVDGPGKTTYSVPGLPAGTWLLRCDPHPDMKGTFVSG